MIDINGGVLQWLASDDGFVLQIAVFITLILGGLGLPIPEDVPIVLAGVAASEGIVALRTIFLICYFGVLIGDQIMYMVGRLFGQRFLNAGKRSRLLPSITDKKVERVRDGLRKRRLMYIFIARHIFPIRSATFLIAGALRIPFQEFLFADAIAALVSVSLVLALGYFLGQTFTPEAVEHLTHQANIYIIVGVFLLIVGYLIRRQFVKKHHVITEELELPAEPEEVRNVNGL